MTYQTTSKEHHQAHILFVRRGNLLKTALQEFAFYLILSLMKVVETDVINFLLMPCGLSENLCIFFKWVTGHVRILKHENVFRLLIFQEQSSSQGIQANGEKT